jgi:hypothetical protein
MEEIKKDYKNLAIWSFYIGLIGILLSIMAGFLPIGAIIPLSVSIDSLLCILILLVQVAGLFLGIKGVNSSRRKMSIAG